MTDSNSGMSMGILFDLESGLSPDAVSLKRNLSNMRGMFADGDALEARIAESDEMVYEFYDMQKPEVSSEVAFGTISLGAPRGTFEGVFSGEMQG